MEAKSLAWSHGVVSVETLGGMLGPTIFVLSDGRQIAPFHIAPWFDQPEAKDQPGILRRLRGEWPCVPFGAAGDRAAGQGWPASTPPAEPDLHPHGYASNHDWVWRDVERDAIGLAIHYPDDHPIARLERKIIPVAGLPALEFELTIHVRADCVLPIGLHSVLRLPVEAGSAQVQATAKAAAIFPGRVDDTSIFEPWQVVDDWHAIPLQDGSRIDPSRVPLPQRTEDLLQLIDVGGKAGLINAAEGYRVDLSWNAEHFPDLLLWFSNRGRQHAPWNGRHLALGVEPVCSAFDLGQQISSAPNPINALGGKTARAFRAGDVFVTEYRVDVTAV